MVRLKVSFFMVKFLLDFFAETVYDIMGFYLPIFALCGQERIGSSVRHGIRLCPSSGRPSERLSAPGFWYSIRERVRNFWGPRQKFQSVRLSPRNKGKLPLPTLRVPSPGEQQLPKPFPACRGKAHGRLFRIACQNPFPTCRGKAQPHRSKIFPRRMSKSP